jgi:predicted amidophosphoribosyltransferase
LAQSGCQNSQSPQQKSQRDQRQQNIQATGRINDIYNQKKACRIWIVDDLLDGLYEMLWKIVLQS